MNSFDLRQQKVITGEDIEAAGRAGAAELLVREDAIFTPSARDAAAQKGMSIINKPAAPAATAASATSPAAAQQSAYGGSSPAPVATAKDGAWERLFHSPEAMAIKQEICSVGRKLWQRQYVDGNGGNISYRLTDEAVICTPTLVSKADMTPDDLCLVDLAGNQLAGGRPRTSEILMHLEIYKAVPEAKAVAHCHPPHATAYAITGRVPPTCIIPEYEVFIGKVGLSPYETPGTQKFAETVLPFVKTHNTVLLSNHGIVCWADTVTHAEWYAEVVDTYCWTLMLAQQLGAPLSHISAEKATDLLAIKQRLGLPDARVGSECPICDMPDRPGGIAVSPSFPAAAAPKSSIDVDALIQAVTESVLAALNKKA
jgi:L-fuculose-phosphate aldolase